MYSREALRLDNAFESPHAPFSKPRGFVRLLCTVVGVAVGDVKRIRNQFSMGNPVTAQLVGNDFPRLISMTQYQSAEKPLGSPRFPPVL